MGNGALAIGPKLPRPSSTLPSGGSHRQLTHHKSGAGLPGVSKLRQPGLLANADHMSLTNGLAAWLLIVTLACGLSDRGAAEPMNWPVRADALTQLGSRTEAGPTSSKEINSGGTTSSRTGSIVVNSGTTS